MNLLILGIVHNEDNLVAYTNLINTIQVNEVRIIEQGGIEVMKKIAKFRCKPKITMLVIAILHENCKQEEHKMKKYLKTCFQFSCITGVNLSFILFSIIAFKLYGNKIQCSGKLQKINWNSIETINDMPHWAVDCNTFRGLNGTDTIKHLDADQKQILGDKRINEFHGVRPKSIIQDLFVDLSIKNKFHKRTNEIYNCYPENEQRIDKMIKRFETHLKDEHSFLFT